MSKFRHSAIIFYSALGISLLIHAWFLVLWFITSLSKPDVDKAQQPNITYFSKSPQMKSEFVQDGSSGFQGADLKEVFSQKQDEPVLEHFLKEDILPKSAAHEPNFLAETPVAEKTQRYLENVHRTDKNFSKVALKKISIPMLASGDIPPENYPDYFNKIGEQIRKRAYRMTKGMDGISGEARVNFVLSSDGSVSQIEVSAGGSQRVRDLAADIVRTSAPFEPFTPEMGNKDLACEVALEFKLE